MKTIQISEDDLQWLNTYYPTLKHERVEGIDCLSGSLELFASFDKKQKNYRLYESLKNGVLIRDVFEIRIEFQSGKHSPIAQVRETGGRIEKTPAFHVNPDQTMCMLGALDEKDCFPRGLNLKDFFYNVLIPFFCDQSYHEKFEIWPRGEYSHGAEGIFENLRQKIKDIENLVKTKKGMDYFDEIIRPNKKKLRKHHKCICESGKKFHECHPQVWERLRAYKKSMRFWYLQYR